MKITIKTDDKIDRLDKFLHERLSDLSRSFIQKQIKDGEVTVNGKNTNSHYQPSVGDVIEINGLVCKVEEINLRTTTVLTRNDKYIILPNTDLTRNQLINWTHSDIASRFEVNVGVDYSSDVKLVMKILFEAAINQPGVLKNPKPFTRFTDFGESSLNFSIIFWSEDVFRVENIKSELRVKIFDKLNENNITIPFPQRVVHTKQSS